jgi:methionyl-tRNA synthetase
MLKAEGSYILPDNVPANEFLNLEGNKLSTSKIGRFGCTNIW